MTLPIYASFIDGKIVEDTRDAFDLVAPRDGKVIDRIAEAGPAGVDKAVAAANSAFAQHRKQPAHVRIGRLKAAPKALLQACEDVAARFAKTSASRSGWRPSKSAVARSFSKQRRPR